MDKTDAKLLDELQNGLPLCEAPFERIAKSVGISEEETLCRIQAMKDRGVIRRISGFFDPRKIGYESTLCAMKVPEREIEAAASAVNAYPEVTHHYLRENDRFNLWFTVIAENPMEIARIIREIEEKTGLCVCSFPAEQFFKIHVRFPMEDNQ